MFTGRASSDALCSRNRVPLARLPLLRRCHGAWYISVPSGEHRRSIDNGTHQRKPHLNTKLVRLGNATVDGIAIGPGGERIAIEVKSPKALGVYAVHPRCTQREGQDSMNARGTTGLDPTHFRRYALVSS